MKTALLVLALSVAVVASSLTILSLRRQTWTTLSSASSFPLTNLADGSLTFDFPAIGTSINYLYAAKLPRMAPPSTLSVSFAVHTNGPVLFDWHTEPFNTCDVPATVRPFVLANNDWSSEYGRWWSNPASYQLAAGSATLTLPLTPDLWSDVNGHMGTYDDASRLGFANAISHLSSVGLTFGGGCFFGHGVVVSGGTASFTVIDYRLF